MESRATELLRGAVDLHTHSHPEIGLDIAKRLDDWEWATMARDLGMRAIVLKSHMWPTMATAYHLRHFVPGIPVFGSITLNTIVGGVEPWVAEAAARLGAKVLFMPTWSSANDLRQQGFSKALKLWYTGLRAMTPERGISIIDAEGRLLPNAAGVLEVAHARNLVLCTGHLSADESIALAEEARRIGFSKLVFSHPHTGGVGASMEQIVRMAELGAYVEQCYLGIPTQRVDLKQMEREIRQLGAARCVLTTDYFREWCPAPPEMLRMAIGTMLELGFGEDAIRTMVQENPSRLLDLDETVEA